MTDRRNISRIISATLFVIGVIFMVFGIYNNETIQIFRKAAMICLECIGIG